MSKTVTLFYVTYVTPQKNSPFIALRTEVASEAVAKARELAAMGRDVAIREESYIRPEWENYESVLRHM